MKVIFLDIDGVMNNQLDWMSKVDSKTEQFKFHRMFCDKAWQLLSDVCQKTDAKVVLSSSWRIGFTNNNGVIQVKNKDCELSNKLLEYFNNYNIKLAGLTKDHYTLRGLEITEYIGKHLKYGDKWVVIDDEASDIEGIIPSWGLFIKTEFKTGLLQEHCEQIIKYFNGGKE